MNDSEFDIIKKYFSFAASRDDVVLAGGDDCAIVSVPDGQQLLVTTDTFISGVHFPEHTSAKDIAYKAIMVNLSDLAAMGATPAWLTLAISLPEVNGAWLQAFSDEVKVILSEFDINLIGGDTTRGDLSITIQAMGFCERGRALRRDRAETGDKIYVTGELGDAAIGLSAVLKNIDDDVLSYCVKKLERPEARVRFAEALTAYSRCAIDISDGLVADLGHIIEASHCGARIRLSDIPLSSSAEHYFREYDKNKVDWTMVLAHGDDYELCFTVSRQDQTAVETLAERYKLRLSCIGDIVETDELSFVDDNDSVVEFLSTGFRHF
ncbi:MAG TPA: thiamine-phosphate kinase [Gammaproteobacteria bacterium]|nr:thiamine-phosphate kinase [Gammaproteobacteria bacterium]